MRQLTEEKKCLFMKDGMFFIEEIEKTVEYDNTIDRAYREAKKEIKQWFKTLPNLVTFFDEYCYLFGKRVKINKWGNIYYVYVESKKLINDLSLDETDRYNFNDEELLQVLNTISQYGVDDFMEKYINDLKEYCERMEEKCEVLLNEDEREEVKKNCGT